MNRLFKFFFIMFFVMIGIGTTNAQVEIVSSDLNYISGNDISSQSSHDPIEIDLGEAGANQSWDFSGIELEGEHIDHIRDTEGKPGADSFPTANIVAYEVPEDDEWWLYSYFNVNENNVNVLGMVIVLNEPDTTMIWEVETIGNAYNFPLAYNDEWSYVLNLGTDEDINIDSVHCVVDAWGEITDLAGTYDCIRIQRFTRSFEQNGDEIETETHYNYIWLAPDFGDIVSISSEDGEENPDFTNGEFHRTTGIEMTSVNSRTEPGIPAYSCLEPAYPNPFNSTTRISYDLASVSDVRITIHDLTGREITEIVNAQQSAGSYITIWNAENITAGVYLVKMEASDFTNVSKLVLVK